MALSGKLQTPNNRNTISKGFMGIFASDRMVERNFPGFETSY
jgi:hypothetical protein